MTPPLPSQVRSRAWLLKTAMPLAVLVVLLLAWLDLRREQARALGDFSGEQRQLAAASAVALEARLAAVARDLKVAARLSGAARADHLRDLVAGEGAYRGAEVVDAAGRSVLALPGPAANQAGEPRARCIAAARAGALALSPPLGDGGADAGQRLYGLAAGTEVVLLRVDTARLFEGIAAPGAAPTRWLLVDDRGGGWFVWRSGATGGAARWEEEPAAPGEAAALRATMREGARGTLSLGREAAATLGLEHRLAVAGYAPFAVAGQRPWSLAVVASAMRVRDRGRVSAWRLVTATALAGLLVGVFGAIGLRQERRALALGEALRIAEATAALRERSEKLVEALPIGVLALDGDGRVTGANPYLQTRGVRVGRSLAESLAGPIDERRPGRGPSPTEQVAALSAQVAEACQRRAPVERSGIALRLPGEELRHVDAYAVPLARPLADAQCFVVLHDRTELRRLEETLFRAEKLATIGTLAAGVAHEVGTPLGIISGRAEQLLTRVPDDAADPVRKGLTSILTQVEKVSTTIRQLLDFARARRIEAAPVSPSQVLAGAAALLDHRFRQAQVRLEVQAEATLPPLLADAGQLEQVFVNLLINACDACAAGGRVRASGRALDGATIELTVSDDGCGISREHLPQVLDPFFTTKKRGQGTGLGLTIAADIVRNHGGALEIDSVVGAGTTVRVRLPTAKEPA